MQVDMANSRESESKKDSWNVFSYAYFRTGPHTRFNMSFAELPNMTQVKWEPDPTHPQSMIIKDPLNTKETVNKV